MEIPEALNYGEKIFIGWVSRDALSRVYIGDVKRDVACNIAGIITPYLLNLANRNDPISVVPPKLAKASK
jgi:hypothetical protein